MTHIDIIREIELKLKELDRLISIARTDTEKNHMYGMKDAYTQALKFLMLIDK